MATISADEAGGQNVLAFLDMIAYAEGTDNGRQKTNHHGYDVVVGGGLFTDFSDHPRKLVKIKSLGVSSTAAGRYQLLSRYWDAYRDYLKLPDFGPVSQDKVAIQQIRECKAIELIQEGKFAEAVWRCRRIWASMPSSGWNQHEHDLVTLEDAFREAGGTVTV